MTLETSACLFYNIINVGLKGMQDMVSDVIDEASMNNSVSYLVLFGLFVFRITGGWVRGIL